MDRIGLRHVRHRCCSLYDNMTLKMGTAAAPRYLEEQVEVPDFQTVAQAEAYLAHIPVLLGKGEINSQSALELSTLTKNWLDAIYAHQEYDLKLAAQGGGTDTTIRIEGGLPPLPGTNINMSNEPSLNGQHVQAINGGGSGPVIEHQPSQDPEP